MLGEDNNITDAPNGLVSLKDNVFSISYTKTNKLISALYMVTDILEKDEPMRSKLRTLGTDIISDIHIGPENALFKIGQIISFLGIASDVNIISEMNCSILRKEFLELNQSIKESVNKAGTINRQINLLEFFENSSSPSGRIKEGFLNSPHLSPLLNKERGNLNSKGHLKSNSIGVQKGHTLMKALRGIRMSDRVPSLVKTRDSFDLLKKERRYQIIVIIKTNTNGITITDIKSKAQGSLASCSEKTLQRELISMVKDGVLKKVGEKRWSKYFIK